MQNKFNVANVFYCNEQFETYKISENLNLYSSFIIFSDKKKEMLLEEAKKFFLDDNLKVFTAFDINKSRQIDDIKKEIAQNNLNQIIKLF